MIRVDIKPKLLSWARERAGLDTRGQVRVIYQRVRFRKGVVMTRTLEATFDGKVLRPDHPLDLEPNTRVRVTIETNEMRPAKRDSLARFVRFR